MSVWETRREGARRRGVVPRELRRWLRATGAERRIRRAFGRLCRLGAEVREVLHGAAHGVDAVPFTVSSARAWGQR